MESWKKADAVTVLTGEWQRQTDELRFGNIVRRVVYQSSQEPGFVAWPTVWKDPDGTINMTLVEALGGSENYPPVYNFNQPGIDFRQVNLSSKDQGKTFQVTSSGKAIPLLQGNFHNSDHHFRAIVVGKNNELLRMGQIPDPEKKRTVDVPVFSPEKNRQPMTFPYNYEDHEAPFNHLGVFRSIDGGKSWEVIYTFPRQDLALFTGFKRLRNGNLVTTGALRRGKLPYGFAAIISESTDEGRSWSDPVVFAENDEIIRGLCEESDFVELADGRLLLVNRVVGPDGRNVKVFLKRNAEGVWERDSYEAPENFVKTPYPAMLRTSDGVIFYDQAGSFMYSCDEGKTFKSYHLHCTYYGQFVELAPGRMLSVTQNNIADSPFPNRYDSSLISGAFDYRRCAVWQGNGVAAAGKDDLSEIHIYSAVKNSARCGLGWGKNADDCWMMLTRMEKDAKKPELNCYMKIYRVENGQRTLVRECFVDSVAPGAEYEMQLDAYNGTLKCAVKINDGDWSTRQNPTVYLCYPVPADHRGKPLMISDGDGEFIDFRYKDKGNLLIRDNWQNPDNANRQMELDAGRTY